MRAVVPEAKTPHAITPAGVPAQAAPTIVTNNIIMNSNNTTNVVNLTLQPWEHPDQRIVISTTMLEAVFAESERLMEYCNLTDDQKTNADGAVPYVLEALMALVKRAHKDPAARNICLNPKRADQVMVFDEMLWKVKPLTDAIYDIFDSVTSGIQRIIVTPKQCEQLSHEVQGTASYMRMLYKSSAEV
jgi:hypothetical protein